MNSDRCALFSAFTPRGRAKITDRLGEAAFSIVNTSPTIGSSVERLCQECASSGLLSKFSYCCRGIYGSWPLTQIRCGWLSSGVLIVERWAFCSNKNPFCVKRISASIRYFLQKHEISYVECYVFSKHFFGHDGSATLNAHNTTFYIWNR
jgi:hypothetical protein